MAAAASVTLHYPTYLRLTSSCPTLTTSGPSCADSCVPPSASGSRGANLKCLPHCDPVKTYDKQKIVSNSCDKRGQQSWTGPRVASGEVVLNEGVEVVWWQGVVARGWQNEQRAAQAAVRPQRHHLLHQPLPGLGWGHPQPVLHTFQQVRITGASGLPEW